MRFTPIQSPAGPSLITWAFPLGSTLSHHWNYSVTARPQVLGRPSRTSSIVLSRFGSGSSFKIFQPGRYAIIESALVADLHAFTMDTDRADGLAGVDRKFPLPIYKLLSQGYDLAVGGADDGNGPLAPKVEVLGRKRR